jgi:quercetin dioxygenase-like cupin family protein
MDVSRKAVADQDGSGKVRMTQRRKLERDLGSTVRRLRRRQGMSVRKLATGTDFSPSFISQLERNKVSPSISSLERLAFGLGVTLGDFFADASPTVVVPRHSRQRLTSGWSRARIEALDTAHPHRLLEAVMVTMSSGGTSGKRPHPHERDRFVIVFDGLVTLTLADSTYTLRRGDSVILPAGVPHHWHNRGKRKTSLVIVSARR